MASTMINLKVDREIQNDIFAKILVTDWESLTAYSYRRSGNTVEF